MNGKWSNFSLTPLTNHVLNKGETYFEQILKYFIFALSCTVLQ